MYGSIFRLMLRPAGWLFLGLLATGFGVDKWWQSSEQAPGVEQLTKISGVLQGIERTASSNGKGDDKCFLVVTANSSERTYLPRPCREVDPLKSHVGQQVVAVGLGREDVWKLQIGDQVVFDAVAERMRQLTESKALWAKAAPYWIGVGLFTVFVSLFWWRLRRKI
jgi:hypothetical protein